MPGPALEISYPHVFAVVDTRSGRAACGCCGRDLTGPSAVTERTLAGEDGSDALGPELAHYLGVATQVWREQRILPTEGIAGHIPLNTGQGYGYCGNCEAPLVIPVAEHGRPLHQGVRMAHYEACTAHAPAGMSAIRCGGGARGSRGGREPLGSGRMGLEDA